MRTKLYLFLLVILLVSGSTSRARSDSGYYEEPMNCGGCTDGCTPSVQHNPPSVERPVVLARVFYEGSGTDPVAKIQLTPGASWQATLTCNKWINDDNDVDIEIDKGDAYDICGWSRDVQRADKKFEEAATPAMVSVQETPRDAVVETSTRQTRVLRQVKIPQGSWPRQYVDGRHATNGADLEATYQCNGWTWGTNPKVKRGETVQICGRM